jgi:hypothetical protein
MLPVAIRQRKIYMAIYKYAPNSANMALLGAYDRGTTLIGSYYDGIGSISA